MVWVITSATFLATVGILVALVFAFSPADHKVAGRLARVLDAAANAERTRPTAKKTEWLKDGLASVGKLMPSGSTQVSRTQLLMIRAGYRSGDAMLAMRGMKVL